jgi:UDP-glucose 4-epimerase
MTVYGDGTQRRCFCSVHDVVDGLVRVLAQRQAQGMVINLGTQEEWSIMDLALRIQRLTGSSSKIELIPYEKAYGPGFDDMKRRVPDIDRAWQLLAWRPSRSLDDIIAEMAGGAVDPAYGGRELTAVAI